MGLNILIVEDEKKIAELLRDYLERAGYAVILKERGDQVIPHLKSNAPDLILLDIMLPGMDGMEVCRQIRKFSNVPVVMITARVEEIDRLIGLEFGADDYICKPFSPREVVARVKAVLRRTHPVQEEKRITLGSIMLDEGRRLVTINGQRLKLTPIEFGLLKTFMAHPDRIFTRGELVKLVSGYEFEGYERTIDSHIKNMRKKISDQMPDQQIITTVYGFGYKLDFPVGEDT
ncbi:MAG TPA: response regulator [Syntrophorhabdaceae bacterium]|nr:response regulator [Syntrophorhabdaceae bacterium]HQM81337.1 response regulator [Syntrophorhabdaceae bacterium]